MNPIVCVLHLSITSNRIVKSDVSGVKVVKVYLLEYQLGHLLNPFDHAKVLLRFHFSNCNYGFDSREWLAII